MRALVLLAALGVAGLSSPARAHQQGVAYSDVTVDPDRVRWDLSLSHHDLLDADANGDQRLDPDEILEVYPKLRSRFERGVAVVVGGKPCPVRLEDFDVDPMSGSVTFRLRGPCHPGEPLIVEYGIFARTGEAGQNFAKIRWNGQLAERIFTRNETQVTLAGPPTVLESMRRFFLLGVEHIATGYDHVLFLIALLLVGGGLRTLVGIVTAFTVAHSVTLALATLELVTLPSRLVEATIAFSIAWVAVENIVLDTHHGRWRVTFLFGLVHGFGFASILRDLHLPARALATSLLSFNLGVEAGQVAVVLIAYPLIAALQRSRYRRALVVGASAVILVLALVWFVERAFA